MIFLENSETTSLTDLNVYYIIQISRCIKEVYKLKLISKNKYYFVVIYYDR